jgi:SAM-dependent methyltransferase
MLYTYGLKIGTKLVRRDPKAAARYLVRPVNYWRTLEYQLISDALQFDSRDCVLDVGSPKLLSIYLAKVIGAEVYSTDIDDYFLETQSLVADVEQVPPDRLHLQVEDGRHLTFADDTFNKVYSLSVLEHIPEDGDTACIKEIARVLAPGGRCAITVPFWPTGRVDYIKDKGVYWTQHSVDIGGGQVFYQRRYSEPELFDRLVTPSGLRLEAIKYVGERVLKKSSKELSDYLPAVSGPVQPLLSKLCHTDAVASWQTLDKPLCALIVLEK